MALSIQDAQNLISELRDKEIALGRKPETWYTYANHVYGAANAAKKIASRVKSLNPDEIYVSALLHDICRTEEDRVQRFHGILGYEKLIDKDEKAARAALVHMFPWNELPPFEKCYNWFYGNEQDYKFVANYIKKHELNEADLLVQLSDVLANKDGFVTVEQRMEECAKRRGINVPPQMLAVRQKLKTHFDQVIGGNVYNLFITPKTQDRTR